MFEDSRRFVKGSLGSQNACNASRKQTRLVQTSVQECSTYRFMKLGCIRNGMVIKVVPVVTITKMNEGNVKNHLKLGLITLWESNDIE